MSFGVIQYKSPFRPVPRDPKHVCGFCSTKVDVKYAYDVDSSEKYPEESRADSTSVYSCSSCTLRKMYSIPSHQFEYDFDISDPYKFMSTLQRMYKDVDTMRDKFHKNWFYCYGCMKYVRMADTTEDVDTDNKPVLKCAHCGSIHKHLD